MRAVRYAFDEALLGLWRGRQSGVLSTATIAVALFVLGGFLLCTSNLERLGEEWSRTAEVSVYLTDQATADDRQAIERLLAPGALVASVEFVSKDEALRRFKRTFADLATTVDTLEGNPLPASYEVKLVPGTRGDAALDALAGTLRSTGGVSDVRYDRQWLDRLVSVVSVVRVAGWLLGGMLTVAAALTVANVVRLGLYARRDELDIMQLVGAPTVFVRGPFIVEGILQGGLGAVAALIALAVAFVATRGPYLIPIAAALNLSSVRFLSPLACLWLLAGGMLVGCLGGFLASRRA
jgi:cell division transport system permease protein